MLEFRNIKVYDLRESVCACRNAMRIEPEDLTDENFEKSLKRAKKLVYMSHDGVRCHASFRKGILVAFDMIYPNYISPEMQRYHWFEYVMSSSKMHRLQAMVDGATNGTYNKYVDEVTKQHVKELADEYNRVKEDETSTPQQKYVAWMKLVSNCPQGIQLFTRVTTNYEQLATMYEQRKNHKLKEDWGAFRTMCENLPYFHELFIGGLS